MPRSRTRTIGGTGRTGRVAPESSSQIISSSRSAAISPLTVHIGFKADLDLNAFLTQAHLKPISTEKVNIPKMWTLVTCVKE